MGERPVAYGTALPRVGCGSAPCLPNESVRGAVAGWVDVAAWPWQASCGNSVSRYSMPFCVITTRTGTTVQ